MITPVLVTGANGNLGSSVVHSLRTAGIAARAAGTDLTRLRERFPDIETVRLDFHDPSTFEPAVSGARGLFLMRPPAISSVGPTLNSLVEVAARHAVAHVVFSSVTGADTNWLLPHHRVEKHLSASATSWTIVRPGFFAQNLADAYRADIVRDSHIYLPAGRGRATFIDTRDLGDAVAAIFADPGTHRSAAYTLTGPESLSFEQVAAILTRELGRRIRYQPTGAAQYLDHLRQQQVSYLPAIVQTILHVGLRRGQADRRDPTLATLLGHAPRTLAQYVHDHRDRWIP